MFSCICLCVINKSLHNKRFKIFHKKIIQSTGFCSGLWKPAVLLLPISNPDLAKLKGEQRWRKHFKELKILDKPDEFSHCFKRWRRELTPYSDIYQRDQEHPGKEWECSTQVWEGEHLEDGQRPSWHSRQAFPSPSDSFPEPPVTTCPSHICNDSWTRLLL